MISGVSVLVLFLFEVLCNVLLEVLQLAIGNEHVGERVFAFLTDAEQLDLLAIVGKALEGKFHIGLTNEVDLQAQAALKLLLLLCRNSGGHQRFEILNLALQCLAMLLARQIRNGWLAPAVRRVSRECFGRRGVVKNEVRPPIVWLFRHGSTQSCCWLFFD